MEGDNGRGNFPLLPKRKIGDQSQIAFSASAGFGLSTQNAGQGTTGPERDLVNLSPTRDGPGGGALVCLRSAEYGGIVGLTPAEGVLTSRTMLKNSKTLRFSHANRKKRAVRLKSGRRDVSRP